MNLFILSSSLSFIEKIQTQLPRDEFNIIDWATSTEQTRNKLKALCCDIVIIHGPLKDELGYHIIKDLAFINSDLSFILLSNEEHYTKLQQQLQYVRAMVLVKPISTAALIYTLRSCYKFSSLLNNANHTIKELEKNLDDIKIISRAKQLLIHHLQMTEDQAHHHIIKQSMNLRLSPRKIAENILNTYEV